MPSGDSDEVITAAIETILHAIAERRPEAKIVLMGILPRRGMEKRIATLNKSIAKMAKKNNTEYRNPGKVLLGKDGKIDESLFTDGLHPNTAGYRLITPYFE